MSEMKPQITLENEDGEKLELYRLIGEGYKAMHDRRIITIDELKEKLARRSKWNG